MINAENLLFDSVQKALADLYSIKTETIIFQKTRKEFEGDFTLVTFPYTKETKKSPEQLGKEIGEFILQLNSSISAFNVVKGFLNISLNNEFWINYFNSVKSAKNIGLKNENSSGKTIMVEYSSPNTNKPLHLGHVRNNLLGYSVAQILKANGHQVIKTNITNDRGIHICKSMLAWQKFGNGETPQSSGMKGDHLVGKYYVEFDKANKIQIAELIKENESKGITVTKEEIEKKTPLLLEAQEMLLKWEAGDKEVVELWKTMNGWVYEGFAQTYKILGVDFDVLYYESNTYLLGKEIIQEGLNRNVFYKKENGSVAIDLSKDGLDEKIVLRADGTSVYITQDIGTAIERFKTYPNLQQLIYTVGNEQDYHFKALFKILEKLGYGWAKECYHLSYGMVELPEGKMKSREGTVVDADELLQEMYDTAENTTKELGKVDGFTNEELADLYRTISLGALKYFILKVDPRKKMLFDPKESIDFNGHTGPFIQYTHARIKSVIRKAEMDFSSDNTSFEPNALEKELIKSIYDFSAIVDEAGKTYSPALIANYVYELTKLFNRFYHEFSILKEENLEIKKFRLQLAQLSGQVLSNAMNLLGIHVPERM
ncbi:arginine--tRNA ligase [Aurantibacillus circumpalustris]|uniref:arginine--tRNA ligase n=1 Tax=Aurantibacillus circumpalustris TaxID=3036359 RepID=UPI00295B7B70|nr:arginine--tRNA ligase [Aurantibacillus circumpalustris]